METTTISLAKDIAVMVKERGSSTSRVAAALAEMAMVAAGLAAAAAAVIGVVAVVVRGWAGREAVISCIVE